MLDTIFETSEGSTTLSIVPLDALICIGVALILGLIISIIYIFTNRRKRFSTNFAITLVILPAMVSIVIILVGSDIARAFSIAGVFTLVRFRSLPGDSKDISHVLFAMAIGLAAGMGYIVFAAVATVIIGVVYFILMMTNYGVIRNVEKTLRITIPENLNYQGAFDDLFQEFTDKIYLDKVRTTNMGSMYELTYQLIFKKDADEKKFIDELRCRNGNLGILLCRAEVVEML
ncbi:MAG: DUF4956 domain-containing protein [Lachnospiraceae bacterium]|nr:DUF4956 domain-containing protein [Lachnospiraceae bacterium]